MGRNKKSKCIEYWGMDSSLTEEQMCNANGLFRLYDSSNLLLRYEGVNKWIWKKSKIELKK